MLMNSTLPRNSHQFRTVVLKVDPRKGLGKNVGVLMSRLYVHNAHLAHSKQTTEEMESHVDVLCSFGSSGGSLSRP